MAIRFIVFLGYDKMDSIERIALLLGKGERILLPRGNSTDYFSPFFYRSSRSHSLWSSHPISFSMG